MFERKPRYLIDQNGELRRIYHRQGSFFPSFSRSLRPDKPNLTAVEINGKWVLVEVDGNEQKKAVELQHAATRRQGLVVKSLAAAVLAAAAWNGPFGYRWFTPVKTWLGQTLTQSHTSPMLAHLAQGAASVVLVLVCLLLAFQAARFALSGLKFLALEILYRLRFPFMKGARAQLLPTVPHQRPDLPWNADFENPWDAARRMAAPGQPGPHQPGPLNAAPKTRRLGRS
jgi:hypothetical protein